MNTSLNSTAGIKRFTGSFACPVCKGTDDDERGSGTRCFGFLSDGWIHCTREDLAGNTTYHADSQTYSHKANGLCRCGVEHAPKLKVTWEVDKVYRYIDLDGKVRHETVRFRNPKKFAQRHPGPDGKPIWKLDGVETILYRLPELVAADPSQPVFVVEGEKDVDRLRSLGKVATCNPMGALKWRSHYSDSLVGRDAVIIGDNDTDGRQHAREIAYSLQGKARSIKVVELPGVKEKGDVSDFLDAGGTIDQINDLVAAAAEWVALPGPPARARKAAAIVATPPSTVTGEALDARPRIKVSTDRHLTVEATIQAIASDPHLYRRGDSLGIVIEEESDLVKLPNGVELQHARGSSRFLPLSDAALGCVMTRNAIFVESGVDRSHKPIAKNVHPPNWLIAAVSTWGNWPGVRSLKGIASAPFVRADGSIPRPGYDAATGTLYTGAVGLEEIPEFLTKLDAVRAAARLYDLVADFPFASMADRAVWLASLLTAIQRPVIAGPVPGHAFNGNMPSTGKGLLIDVTGTIATGRGIPTRSYPMDPVEAGKVKLSLALSGIAAVHFDNLPEGGFYGSSELDSAITSITVEGRILGQSKESGSVPLRPCWFLSGNNISPWKDAHRRWLPCNLKTDMENPHERDDVQEKNLRRYVQEHRAELLRDALIILKAHALAGRPTCGGAPLGSFEEWDTIVRGAVWFARDTDCLATQRVAASGSPERSEKLALLEAWASIPGGGNDGDGVTAAEARELAQDSPSVPTRYPALRDALLGLSNDGKLPTALKIGFKLRSMNGQNIGGKKFEKNGERHRLTKWRVRST